MSLQQKLLSPRYKRLGLEAFWILLGQILSTIGSLLSVRVLTQYLDMANYGQLALGLTVVTFVGQFLMSPLGQGIQRYYTPSVEEGDSRGYWKNVQALLSKTIVLISLFAIITSGILYFWGYKYWLLVFIAFIFAIFDGYNSNLIAIQNAARQRLIVTILSNCLIWLRLGMALLFIYLFGAKDYIVLSGYVLASFIIALSQVFFIKKVLNKQVNNLLPKHEDWSKKILAYSYPFTIWGIFTWALLVSDRWALEYFTSSLEVAQFVVLFQLGYSPIAIITGFAMTFLGPIIFSRAGNGEDNTRNENVNKLIFRIVIVALSITALAFLFVLLLHSFIFQIFVAKQYLGISYLLPWMVLSGGLFATGQAISLKFLSEMKVKTMITPKIVTALIGIVLNIGGAYFWGVGGVVCASILFSLIYFLWLVTLAITTKKLLTQ